MSPRSSWLASRFIAGTLAISTAFSAQCLAAAAASPPTSAPHGASLPTHLNLASISKTVLAPAALSAPVSITDGGHKQTVVAGMALTPAQAVAVQQVLNSGTQSLILNLLGSATGGSVIVAPQKLASLVVPHGVTVVSDFAAGSGLVVSGGLSNAGKIYALSTNSAVTNAVISAANISNLQGGLISSLLPAGGMAGFSNAISGLGLTLTANSITNHGTISSAGNLSLNGSSSNFAINNSGGTISAANAINVNGLGTAGNNVSMLGGNWLSSTLNANAGAGNLLVNVNQLSGQLNVTANNSHVFTSTPDLLIGDTNIANDPTFLNLAGGIIATGLLNISNESLAIISTSDISLGANFTFDTNGAGGKGFPITIIAGANVALPTASPTTSDPFLGPKITSGTVKVTGGSVNGGSITCNGCTIDSSSLGSNAGGNILLTAYKGGVGGSGQVLLTGTSLIKTSSVTGKAGNLTIFGPGGITLNGAALADVITANGGVNGSKITLSTATPTGTITADTKGNVTGTLNWVAWAQPVAKAAPSLM